MNTKKPNVIFFLSDQHNALAMGNAGNAFLKTKNLDRLAQEGICFSNAYCQEPICVPSRASLLTSKYCKTLNIYDNLGVLEPDELTLPGLLAQHGYRTAVIGKTHFNGQQFHGYQSRPYGDILGQGHQPDPRRTENLDDSGLGDIVEDSGQTMIPDLMIQENICNAEAAKWIQTHVALHESQPFFLSINYTKPHWPLKPPESYLEIYRNKVELPPAFPDIIEKLSPLFNYHHRALGYSKYSDDEHKRALAAYFGSIHFLDDKIGEIIDLLEYLGLLKETIIIYASDHGEMMGLFRMWQKFILHGWSTKVPFIMRLPEKFFPDAKPKRIEHSVGLIDIFPTICDLCGVPIPKGIEGESLLPLIRGEGNLNREGIFTEAVLPYAPRFAGAALITNQFKFCYYVDGWKALFETDADPYELNNVIDKYPKIAKSLEEKLISWWEPDKFILRYKSATRVKRHKHLYPYSNQWIIEGGTVVDARP